MVKRSAIFLDRDGVLNIPKIKNGKCQSERLARNKPIGTPITDATEKDAITIPIALARLSFGIESPIIAKMSAPKTPPNTPVILLVISRNT